MRRGFHIQDGLRGERFVLTCHNPGMSLGMAESQVLEQVASRLAADPSIQFASVFGSVAEGTARPDSDLDVGVLADAPLGSSQRRALIDMLAQTVGRPVDLVDLREAGPVLLMSALRGKRLVGRGGRANAALLSRAWMDVADFLPIRERVLRQRRTAWTG